MYDNGISSIFSSKRGIIPATNDENWWHKILIWSSLNESLIHNFSSTWQSTKKKSVETVYFQYSKFQKGNNSYKKLMTLELHMMFIQSKLYTKFQLNMSNWRHSNLICSTVKQSYMQFQLNVSKHVGENCGKLCISSISSSKRGIRSKLTTLDLICRTVKQSYMQNFSSICQSM